MWCIRAQGTEQVERHGHSEPILQREEGLTGTTIRKLLQRCFLVPLLLSMTSNCKKKQQEKREKVTKVKRCSSIAFMGFIFVAVIYCSEIEQNTVRDSVNNNKTLQINNDNLKNNKSVNNNSISDIFCVLIKNKDSLDIFNRSKGQTLVIETDNKTISLKSEDLNSNSDIVSFMKGNKFLTKLFILSDKITNVHKNSSKDYVNTLPIKSTLVTKEIKPIISSTSTSILDKNFNDDHGTNKADISVESLHENDNDSENRQKNNSNHKEYRTDNPQRSDEDKIDSTVIGKCSIFLPFILNRNVLEVTKKQENDLSSTVKQNNIAFVNTTENKFNNDVINKIIEKSTSNLTINKTEIIFMENSNKSHGDAHNAHNEPNVSTSVAVIENSTTLTSYIISPLISTTSKTTNVVNLTPETANQNSHDVDSNDDIKNILNATINKGINILKINKTSEIANIVSNMKNISLLLLTSCEYNQNKTDNINIDAPQTSLGESEFTIEIDDEGLETEIYPNVTDNERRQIKEATEYGLKKMNELFEGSEKRLYNLGYVLEDDNPARFVAAFNAPKEDADKMARYGYAALQATFKLKEIYSANNGGDDLESREEGPFPSRGALRQSAFHDQCPLRGSPRCPPASKRYRTHDGTCNNPSHPRWGSSMTPVQRFLPPSYSDGLQAPRLSVSGAPLPSPREISANIHENRRSEASSVTHLLMQWGQFIDHDVTSSSQSRGFNGSVPRCCGDGGRDVEPAEFLHPECLPILVPANDPFYRRFGIRCLEFLRSSPASRQDCELGWREQINQVTAYLDGSPLYGSSVKQSDKLRLFRNGMLQYGRVQSRKPLLSPEREDKDELCRRGAVSTDCFKSGDNRVNEHPGLVAMHIVWLRMHNRMANELAHLNSHWSDEKIYQETRKIVGAMIQHINNNEFLPIVVGAEVVRLFDLKSLRKGFYKGYSRKVNASPGNAFGAAAFRFGHSLVQSSFMRYNRFHEPLPGNVSLHDEVSNPNNLWSFSAVDHLLTGMLDQPAQKRDEFITDELTNHLFQTPRFRFGMDLAAINIQRGRDHGLPPYVAWREPCGLTNIENWSDLYKIMSPRSVNRLQDIYRSVKDIDLFTGGMCERPVVGGLVGPTFACIIAQQFSNLRKGDRFWYENGNFESSFTPAQLQQIRKVSLAQVMCKTLDSIITIQPFVFLSADDYSNERLSCDSDYIENFELSPWIERQSNIANDISDFDRNDQTTRRPVNLQLHEKLEVQFPKINITVTTTKPSHSTETVTVLDNKLDFGLPQHKLPDDEDNDSQDTPPTGQHKIDGKLDFRAANRKLQNSMSSLKRYFDPIDQHHQRQKNLGSSNVYNILPYNTFVKRHRSDKTDDTLGSHLNEDSTSDSIRETKEPSKTYQYDRVDNLYYSQLQPNDKQNHEPSHHAYDDFHSNKKEKFQNYDHNTALYRPTDNYQNDELHRYKNQYQTDRYQNVRPIKVTDNNKRFTYLVNIVPKTTPRYQSDLRDPVKITYQNSFPQRYHYPNLNSRPIYENNDFVQRPLTYVTVQSPENDYYNNQHDINTDNRYESWTKIQSNFQRQTPNIPMGLLKNSPIKTYGSDMTNATPKNDNRLITFPHISKPDNSIKSIISNIPGANSETTHSSVLFNNKFSNDNFNSDFTDRTIFESFNFNKDTSLHKGVIKDNKPIQMTIPQLNGQTIIKTEKLNSQTPGQNLHDKRPNRNDKTEVNDITKLNNEYKVNTSSMQVSSSDSKNNTAYQTDNKTILNETKNEKELHSYDTRISDRYETEVFINNQPKVTNYDYVSTEQNRLHNREKDTKHSDLKNNKSSVSQEINYSKQQINYNHDLHPTDSNEQEVQKLFFTFEDNVDSILSDYRESLNDGLKQKVTDFTDATTDTNPALTDSKLVTFYTYKPLEKTTEENTNFNKWTNENDRNKKLDVTTPNSVRYFYIGNVLHKYPQQNIADYESFPGVIRSKTPMTLKQNLAIIDENYNNPWKKLSVDRTEFADLDLNFRVQSNIIDNSKTVTPLSLPIDKDNTIKRSSMDTNISEQSNTKKLLKKGNIHVPFEVIPSENSPNLWKFYHEREEMPNAPKKLMPQMASDPQALKELPKPMNLSLIADYRKKNRPTA